jgi:hypothetical protein
VMITSASVPPNVYCYQCAGHGHRAYDRTGRLICVAVLCNCCQRPIGPTELHHADKCTPHSDAGRAIRTAMDASAKATKQAKDAWTKREGTVNALRARGSYDDERRGGGYEREKRQRSRSRDGSNRRMRERSPDERQARGSRRYDDADDSRSSYYDDTHRTRRSHSADRGDDGYR